MNATAALLVLGAAAASAGDADPNRFTVRNPTTRQYTGELVRLALEPPPMRFTVLADDREVPYQVESIDGTRRIWVRVTLGPGESRGFRVVRQKDRAAPEPLVSVGKDGDSYVLENGCLAVRVPAAAAGVVPAPIQAVRLPEGTWVGRGRWRTRRRLKAFSAAVVGAGPLLAKVRLRYDFEGTAGLWGKTPAFALVDVSVRPGQRHAVVEESHEMDRGDRWEFDCAAGWAPRQAICRPHGGGFGRPDLGPWPPDTLKTGQTRMGETLLNLLPRWSQAYDDGWFFAACDAAHAVGCMTVRAGQWVWPHNNMIEVNVKDTADYAGLLCPTWKGRRCWFLVAGPAGTWEGKAAKAYVTHHAFQSLDKLNHDYVLDWPGLEGLLGGTGKDHQGRSRPVKLGGFAGLDFFSEQINPTGGWRRYGRSAVAEAGRQGNLSTLTRVQVIFDPDCYGTYWNFWSPENPNFFTDFIRPGIALTTQLAGHPRFKEFAGLAERKFREDLYHSVTLPGGAGQECPGYLAHAMGSWQALAPICRKYLGFDPAAWPRYKAAGAFLLHLSQPIGGGARRCHPGGDTHPPGPAITGSVKGFATEELPGFGVVFRNRPGTDRETYLALKSGPNRGHYHGDQLSFHYCAAARPLAIDHMCSYAPRPGQEHMHNRVAFHTAAMPYANMDGYERVIAFRTHADVDVAVAQVESERLRAVEKLPPERWDWDLPQQPLEPPLKYRRTVVLVKNAGEDYVVIRDQHAGPKLKATYCLHVLADTCARRGDTFDFGRLTVFCAHPRTFAFEPFDWGYSRKQMAEHTKGIRLTVEGDRSEFVTVLHPGGRPPHPAAIDGGARVGEDEIVFAGGIDDDDAVAYVTVKRRGRVLLTLTGRDIDMDRSQGETGLFVPDAGYPFGTIPDWLIKQRIKRPRWLE